MTDESKSGITLIAGSIGLIVTMAIHPTSGPSSLTPEQVAHLALGSGIAHSLAMVSGLLLFLGACGLTKSIAAADRIAFAAVVTFGFACVAVLMATAVSGFIVPGIMQRMVNDIPANAHEWQVVMSGIFQINQAFARIYSVATALAMILWGASAVRNGGFGRGIAIYGFVASALIIVGIAIGHIRLNVHGMAAVALAQAIWFIVVGAQLIARPKPQ